MKNAQEVEQYLLDNPEQMQQLAHAFLPPEERNRIQSMNWAEVARKLAPLVAEMLLKLASI